MSCCAGPEGARAPFPAYAPLPDLDPRSQKTVAARIPRRGHDAALRSAWSCPSPAIRPPRQRRSIPLLRLELRPGNELILTDNSGRPRWRVTASRRSARRASGRPQRPARRGPTTAGSCSWTPTAGPARSARRLLCRAGLRRRGALAGFAPDKRSRRRERGEVVARLEEDTLAARFGRRALPLPAGAREPSVPSAS
jgi:hypothetical protein